MKIIFSDDKLNPCKITPKNIERLYRMTFGGQRVIGVGVYRQFGSKPSDNMAVKLINPDTSEVSIEPLEQVFYREYISGNDPNATLLKWLGDNFGSVTLSEDIDDLAAAEDGTDPISVTLCEVCQKEIEGRKGKVTCSQKCRKALSRLKSKVEK